MAESQPSTTPKSSEATGSGDLIAVIMSLHCLCKPTAEIATRLHVDEAIVRHAIEHGTLTLRPLPLLWTDESQPSPCEQQATP